MHCARMNSNIDPGYLSIGAIPLVDVDVLAMQLQTIQGAGGM
jgi:hypothetical protein